MNRFFWVFVMLVGLTVGVRAEGKVGIRHATPSGSAATLAAGRNAVHTPGTPVVIKMRRYNMPRPSVISNPKNVVRERTSINVPTEDGRGVRIEKQAARVAPQYHTRIVQDRTLIKDIGHQRHVEVVPNRYYWHSVNNVSYCHYYFHNAHWYGFYHGPYFYWTQYHAGYWWWFDVHFNHWVYWSDGYWWWPGPSGALYVYFDNNYYPYNYGVVTVMRPEVQLPPEDSPAADKGVSWNSPDETRMVQVVGDKAEAFLYNTSSGKPAFIKYLARGVGRVRYSGGAEGKPLQILIDFQDGNFALYNKDGEPMDASASMPEAPAAVPAPPPGDFESPPVPPLSQ